MTGALAVSALLCASSGNIAGPDVQTSGSWTRLVLAPTTADSGSPPLVLDLRLSRTDEGGLPTEAGAPGGDEVRARDLRRWGRALGWSTAAALVATATLGTMAAIDQPTAFGDGRCVTGHPVLGDYGCDRGLSTLHGASGVLSAILYTSNGVLKLAAPESRGTVSASAQPWHRALSYVHLGGIVVQPVIGLMAAFPQVIGMSRSSPTDRFPRDLRTAHLFIGYVTTAAFLTTVALER